MGSLSSIPFSSYPTPILSVPVFAGLCCTHTHTRMHAQRYEKHADLVPGSLPRMKPAFYPGMFTLHKLSLG